MIITAWGISYRVLASASSHFEAVILIIDITFYVGDLLIFLRAWYILSLLGLDIKLKGKYFHGNVQLSRVSFLDFSTQEVRKPSTSWPYLLKDIF